MIIGTSLFVVILIIICFLGGEDGEGCCCAGILGILALIGIIHLI